MLSAKIANVILRLGRKELSSSTPGIGELTNAIYTFNP